MSKITKETIKENVMPCVRKAGTGNDNAVVIPFMEDLEIYFRVWLSDTENFKVTQGLIDSMDMDTADMLEVSKKNFVKDIIKEPITNFLNGVDEDDTITVVTNSRQTYGAGAMVWLADHPQWMADKYILPSSIHEVLLIEKEKIDKDELNKMIQAINETVVDPEDILSDHVYEIGG